MKTYYDPSDEPTAEKPFTFDMEFDDLPTKQLRDMVFKEALAFKRRLLKETSLWKKEEEGEEETWDKNPISCLIEHLPQQNISPWKLHFS